VVFEGTPIPADLRRANNANEAGGEEEGGVARQRAREPKTQKIRGELNMNTLDL